MYKNTKKGGPKLAPLVGMAIKALAPMVISKIAGKAKEKSGLMMKSKDGKEKRATKKAMKEEAKSAPDKMPTLKTQNLPEGDKKTMYIGIKAADMENQLNTYGLRDKDILGWAGTEPIMKRRKTENPREYIRDFIPGLNERNDRYKANRFMKTLDEATKSGEHWRMKEFMRGDRNFQKYLPQAPEVNMKSGLMMKSKGGTFMSKNCK